jgi:Xaa-Pro aminopeptidase
MASAVSLLRAALRELGVHAYFLPHNDSHSNEYLSSADFRMSFLSGFTGSSGHLLVTQDHAFLYTDGRYWLQAEQQLKAGWTLMKLAEGVPRYFEWAVQNLSEGSVIAYDSSLVAYDNVKTRREYFNKKSLVFKGLDVNPVNQIWEDRPNYSDSPVFRHEDIYSGRTATAKISDLTGKMTEKYLFTNALDEIAWLLNLRGSDIDFNPVFFSYLLVEKGEINRVHLFIRQSKVSHLNEYFQDITVIVHDYDEIADFLSGIQEAVLVDGSKCSEMLYLKLKHPVPVKVSISDLKAVKNDREIQGFRDSHVRDALAVCRYLAWLEADVLKSPGRLTEFSAAAELERIRAEDPLNRGLSFATISSVGSNAAIIHYKPKEEDCKVITKDEIYLLDSGGHYLDGTIDTTRTVHFGTPSEEEKDAFTRVLLGNLDLERVVWPADAGISGAELDILARRRLWQKGMDYAHGTGHGVGYFLNVHEGPQGISRARKTVLQPGMNVTNEPGYYLPGRFGIRIENVLFVKEQDHLTNFLGFENVTMVPYDRNLISTNLLDDRDKAFINTYHSKIFTVLSPLLESKQDLLTLEWLQKQTSPL